MMPRSHRRRQHDRRREAEQRRIAREAIEKAREQPPKLPRYVKAVTRTHSGEVTGQEGQFVIEDDGSLKPREEGLS